MDVAELRTLPPLAGMSEVGIARVASRAATFHAEEGRVLALEGDPGAGMFILCEGTIAIELRSGTLELGPGDFFGELAVLDPSPRDATIVSTTPVELLVIGRRRFWTLMEGSPTIQRKVLVGLARRLHELDARDTAARLAAAT